MKNLSLRSATLLVGAIGICTLIFACGDDDKTTTPEPGEFTFRTDAPAQYQRIDRMGMPAVATALISPANKPSYNDDDPEDDATGKWVSDIRANLVLVHDALDDDLEGLGLTPADPDSALAQGGPFIVPDALTLKLNESAGFPNGRRLPDQVIDITLAVILLDLKVHDVETLANVPVNPPNNAEAFSPLFPYLAAKH